MKAPPLAPAPGTPVVDDRVQVRRRAPVIDHPEDQIVAAIAVEIGQNECRIRINNLLGVLIRAQDRHRFLPLVITRPVSPQSHALHRHAIRVDGVIPV